MIAIVNSLAMYATHEDSDIDLFIVTKPDMIWFVRFFSTLILWRHSVWRKWEDIAGNFCLSFFITTEVINLNAIAIENDIYLYYWIYYMKPIFQKNNTYEQFLTGNSWVEIDPIQKKENLKYLLEKQIKKDSENLMIYKLINTVIRFFLLRKTNESHQKLWNPSGIIVSDSILKFHNEDRREVVRNTIFEKNFDK